MTHLLTPKEVSAWFKVSEKTLAQWRWRGAGPEYVKLGGTVRYRRSDMEAWLSSRSRRNTSQTEPELQGLRALEGSDDAPANAGRVKSG